MLNNGSELRIPGDFGNTSRAVQNSFLTSAKFSVIVTDEKGVIQLFNVGAERMLGYSSADVVNKIHLVDFYDPEEVMARTRALSLELSTAIAPGFETLAIKASHGIEDSYELTSLCKDASRLPTSVCISALRDEYGINIGYLFIGADNSARKQFESKLNRALSVAQNANVAKADFLSSMSHELRTPLNAILGFAQLMAGGQPSPTVAQKRNIDLILESGWYQLELINEMLDVALIECGKLLLVLELVPLTEFMLECQVMAQPLAKARGVSLIFPIIGASHFLRADRVRLRQVMVNLLAHAIRNSELGGAIVVDCDTRHPEYIRFSIKHGGGGSSAVHMAQQFQPINRLGQNETAEERNGSGLVLTKRLVELMGGVIGADSNAGTDGGMWLELKRMVQPPAVDSNSSYQSVEQAASAAGGRPRTILYVMDDAANSQVIEELIARRQDLHLLYAGDRVLGVEKARAYLPDVILMDIDLLSVSGVAALRSFAEDLAILHIPVVAVSAGAIPRDIWEARKLCFFRSVTKPIKVNEFMDTLDVALNFAATASSNLINGE